MRNAKGSSLQSIRLERRKLFFSGIIFISATGKIEFEDYGVGKAVTLDKNKVCLAGPQVTITLLTCP